MAQVGCGILFLRVLMQSFIPTAEECSYAVWGLLVSRCLMLASLSSVFWIAL